MRRLNRMPVIALFVFAAFAGDSWKDFFPEAKGVFSVETAGEIIDVAVDSFGGLYLLYEQNDSVAVAGFSFDGKPAGIIKASLGPTESPHPVRLEVSRNGKTILVWGLDVELRTPINWVFDSCGVDILPAENVLKYAEWLQMSPSGDYFIPQGYEDRSGFNDLFTEDWESVQWPGRLIHHGYFVGSASDGDDLVLLTESDTGGTALTLSELPSQKRLFERHLEPQHALILPHRSRMAVGEGIYVMSYPPVYGGRLFGIDGSSGDIIWTVDPVAPPVEMDFSFEGDILAVIGPTCIQLIDSKGGDLSYFCDENPPFDMFQPGIPDISFWSARRVAAVALVMPDYKRPIRTAIIEFDDEWQPKRLTELSSRIEGLRSSGKEYLAVLSGNVFEVYRLPDK